MTKPFSVRYTCENCGHQTSAETGFGRWMRHHPQLQPSVAHIVRTDTDHTVLRYMAHVQGIKTREFQLIIDVEVKEHGAYPDPAQKDILNFKHQLAMKTSRNRHGAKTRWTHKLKSLISGRVVKVRYLGLHLLQFQGTNPKDSAWIKWDGKEITEATLVGLLRLELDPYRPDRIMNELLRDRHDQHEDAPLWDGLEIDHVNPIR